MYGRLNLSAERIERTNAAGRESSTKELVNSSSRLGFRGVEDLGNGLRAGLVLESGFDPSTGLPSQAFFGRQSEVFLGSNVLGQVRLGNFTSEAYYATADYVSLHNHDTGTSADALYAYIGRNTNKISYRAPTVLKGLSLEAAVSAGEGRAPTRTYDFAANYVFGPLQLGLGYEKNGTADQFAVRALYAFGPFVIGGYVQRDEDGYGPNLGERTTARLALAYNVGASEFHVNYGRADDYKRVNDSAADQFTVAYNYNLSKRTKVYAFYTEVDAKARNPYVSDFNSLALGVRHNF